MKMKSIFSSLNAKLALAVLAVGTMFASCYDSENGDVTVTPTPEPKYVISGNITDGATGKAITTAVVTINDEPVDATKGYIYKEYNAAGEYTVSVAAEGYKDVTRTIYLGETVDGGVSVGNADFTLYGVGEEDLLNPDYDQPVDATKAQAEEILALVKADIEAGAAGLDNVTITTDENGNTTLTGEAVTEGAPVNAPYTVSIPKYNGFASTIAQDDNNVWTKAITEGQIWNASAARDLGLSYGMVATAIKYTFDAVAGKSVGAYKVTINFENKVLSYNGAEGIVMYQSDYHVDPVWDSHDSHDSHDGHGNSNGAGGGETME